MMKLPEKIIRYRKANGWSQEEFAEKLNVSRQAVSRWENGTACPDAQNILQISKLFGISADDLLNDDEKIPAAKPAAEDTQALALKKNRRHLIAAIGFSLSAFSALMAAVNSTGDVQLACSLFMLALCAANAAAQFVFFFKKR